MPKTYNPKIPRPAMNTAWGSYRRVEKNIVYREMEQCPFCFSKKIVKFGRRQRKHQTIQYYRCKDCRQMCTPQIYKGKKYPLKIILDGISYYNLGYTKADSCRLLKEKHGQAIRPNTLTNWIVELDPLCRYSRLRPWLYKRYGPLQIIWTIYLRITPIIISEQTAAPRRLRWILILAKCIFRARKIIPPIWHGFYFRS